MLQANSTTSLLRPTAEGVGEHLAVFGGDQCGPARPLRFC